MRICRVDQLTGNEILAKDIVSRDYSFLLARGSVVRKEYIERLKELHVAMVYVEEEGRSIEARRILREEVEEKFTEKVKQILETHTYQHNEELVELCDTAEKIMHEIIADEDVAERVFDIRERGADLYEHSINVCTLATLTALKLKLDKDIIRGIGAGALLHDLGLRYITVDYVNRNVEDMETNEMSEYKKHPVYGYSSVENETWLPKIAKDVILYHHETLDGTGYPLKTAVVPFECQIVGICETLDEMLCGAGRVRSKVHVAVEYLMDAKGKKYDSRIVDALLAFTAVYPAGTRVLTNEGEIGIVIKQNAEFPNRPVLLMVEDKNRNRYEERIIRNLLDEQTIFIERVIE